MTVHSLGHTKVPSPTYRFPVTRDPGRSPCRHTIISGGSTLCLVRKSRDSKPVTNVNLKIDNRFAPASSVDLNSILFFYLSLVGIPPSNLNGNGTGAGKRALNIK